MRTLIDANVVLRYMLHDDETKFPVAEKTIREGAYLLPEVLAEVVYVLLGVYSVPREEIASRLQILVKEVQAEHPEVLETALTTFGTTSLTLSTAFLRHATTTSATRSCHSTASLTACCVRTDN